MLIFFFLLQIPSTAIAIAQQAYKYYNYQKMSILSCCLLFLMCLSLNESACGARLLGEENKFHLSNKNNGDGKMSNLATFSNKLEAAMMDTENKMKESSLIFSKLATQKVKDAREVSDNAVNKGPAAGSYSWSVPRQKKSDKHPGFDVDYSPPKTHPPSHN